MSLCRRFLKLVSSFICAHKASAKLKLPTMGRNWDTLEQSPVDYGAVFQLRAGSSALVHTR